MSHLFIANILTAVHTTLILAVFIGIFLSIRIKRFRPFEALVLLIAVVIWSLYGACPLTTAEAFFRNQSGQDPSSLNQLGFIAHYLYSWFNLTISPTTISYTTYGIAALFLFLSIEWELPLLQRIQRKVFKSKN